MARRYALSAFGFLGGVLLAALLAGALLLATRDDSADDAPAGAPSVGEGFGRDCPGGSVVSGVLDYVDPDTRMSADTARARAEQASLRPEVWGPTTRHRTASGSDRQVWVYDDRAGRAVAEITLERGASGLGWNFTMLQQCGSFTAQG